MGKSAPAGKKEKEEEKRRSRILVVDPDFQIREMLQSSLEDIGITVVSAPNAAEGRRQLSAGGCDLAFISVMLADEPGESLAALAASLGTAVIMMSGHPDGIRRGRATGYDFLAKPFGLKQVLSLVLARLSS